MGALPVAKLSVEEYLALDRVAEIPSEYHDGVMLPIETASWEHGVICANFIGVLQTLLADTPCTVASSAVRVRAKPTRYIVPDIVVVCGEPALTDEDEALTNPKVIVEILSRTTAGYDYSEKFTLYRRLESFEEYVLVSQDQPRVEVFRKTADKRWLITTYEGLDTVINIESLAVSLPMADLYVRVKLPAAPVED